MRCDVRLIIGTLLVAAAAGCAMPGRPVAPGDDVVLAVAQW
jgi:hypothetical protein